MTHMPIRYLDKTSEITLFCRGCDAIHDPIILDSEFRRRIIANNTCMPTLEYDGEFMFGIVQVTMGYVILGPICPKTVDNKRIEQYARRYNMSVENFPIKRRTLDDMCAALVMIHYIDSGEQIAEIDIIANRNAEQSVPGQAESDYQSYMLERSELEDEARFNFSDETRIMRQIRDGNADAIRKRHSEATVTPLDEDRIGKLAAKPFKQYEYTAVTVIALASRAAIDGGLEEARAYLMSDLYLQRLERCKEYSEINLLMMEVMAQYAEQVHKCKLERSAQLYIDQCKNYIQSHLNKHFTVEDIAEKIHLNKSYLSRRFAAEVGVGIQKYTQIKRVEAAANMLKFSDASIETIAYYLCFTSQSHFGKAFKEQTGMTPKKYRETNQTADFSPRRI
jgi:AraC-like DNA-binding protein